MEADVTAPTSRFEQPAINMNGRKVEPLVHLSSGTYHFEVTGKFKPLPSASADEEMSEAAEDDHEAGGVVAIRFEFEDGPLGFNVCREINLVGQPTPR